MVCIYFYLYIISSYGSGRGGGRGGPGGGSGRGGPMRGGPPYGGRHMGVSYCPGILLNSFDLTL